MAKETPLLPLTRQQKAELDLEIRALENGVAPWKQRLLDHAGPVEVAGEQANPDYVDKMFGAIRFMGRLAQGAVSRSREVVEALADPSGSAQFERSMNEQA